MQSTIRLILTNPYAYTRGLERALQEAHTAHRALYAVFVIDPQTLETLVNDLSAMGWLGASSRQHIAHALHEGYRLLAQDTLQTVQAHAQTHGIPVETEVVEAPISEYLARLPTHEPVLVSATSKPTQALTPNITWIQEA
ncbi:hypothetical protein [Marinithermus hydrothermalis]|uniref:UspA domain-containing protein n=1 Tax=Marinithermus hydrothermalis (strain DSM 14884 / JCM 11576 / T1) TaxID=869210 RepID=F2NQY7_MARHT|nr:hypothetical protein [Marinithermus hydrothermalis]AEB12565.1 hypothetical protein Marky_1833 [Marinithermus hydrothermalis DSM 14884]